MMVFMPDIDLLRSYKAFIQSVILSLDIICRLIIPSVILAFLTALAHCFEGFKSFEIITSKSVSSVTDF